MPTFDNYAVTPAKGGYGTPGFQMPSPGSSSSGSSGGGGGNTTNSTSTTNSSSDSQTNLHETSSSNTHTTVKNMDDASLAALDKLIAQLEAGGTSNMLEDRKNRLLAIQNAQSQLSGYSKDAAMADSRGAMDAETARALQQILPSLTRSAEGAGTSKNSMRELMLQNAASNAAQGASVIGLKAAADYGQVSNGVSAILAQLVAMKDPAADALLAALNISKGAVQNTDSTTTNVHDSQSNTHTQGTSTTNGSVTAPAQQQGMTPGFNSGSAGFQMPAASKPAANPSSFNPNDMMSSFGPQYVTPGGSSGLSGVSYGKSNQGISDYLGVSGSNNFANQFTFG